MYGCFPYIATMLREAGETRASIAGIVIAGFGIGGALYGALVSRLLPLLGERQMMRFGGAALGFCLLLIAARLAWPFEFMNFALLGFGFYCLHAVVQIYASELAPTARGSAMALHSFFFFLGQAIGPIVYGAGLSTIGLNPVLCDWRRGTDRGRLRLRALAAAAFGNRIRRLATPAIRRDALVGRQPHILRQFPRLPKHVDRHAAARIPVAADAQPFRVEQRGEFLADSDRAVLVEGAMIAEAVRDKA